MNKVISLILFLLAQLMPAVAAIADNKSYKETFFEHEVMPPISGKIISIYIRHT